VDSLLTIDDGRARREVIRLSPRHGGDPPPAAGLDTPGSARDEFAVLLYQEESNASRLRAEFNRLCHLWVMSSLRRSQATADWLGVEAHLAPGAVAAAMRADRGPVLHGAGLGVWLRGVSRRCCVRPCSTAASPT
jgi:hypothetical protein